MLENYSLKTQQLKNKNSLEGLVNRKKLIKEKVNLKIDRRNY